MQQAPGAMPPSAPPKPPTPPMPPQGGAGASGGLSQLPPQFVHLLQALGGKLQGAMGTGLEGLKHGQQAMDEKIGQTEGDAGKAIMAALQKILGASGTGAEKGVGGPASPYAPAIKALSGEEQTPGTPLSGK